MNVSGSNMDKGGYNVNKHDISKEKVTKENIENFGEIKDVKQKVGWSEWAKSCMWSSTTIIASHYVFNNFVWPSLQSYLSPLTMGNPIVLEAAKVFFQGAFITGCKNFDFNELYDQFIDQLQYGYIIENENYSDVEDISEKTENKEKTEKKSLGEEMIYKGTTKVVALVPQKILESTTGIKVPNIYFSSALDSFYQNKKNQDMEKRTISAIESGAIAGTRVEILKAGTKFGGKLIKENIKNIF